MNSAYSQVTGLYRIALGQRRFKSGALYVSAIHTKGALEAIDVRYFVEDANRLIPTRQGFRVRAESFKLLHKIMQSRETSLKNAELWRGATRKLVARYCDDEYGKAVDIRYFSDSARYKGWEPRGIRLRVEDFAKLRGILLQPAPRRIDPKVDLFLGKQLVVTRGPEARGKTEHLKLRENPDAGPYVKQTINEALRKFIDGD